MRNTWMLAALFVVVAIGFALPATAGGGPDAPAQQVERAVSDSRSIGMSIPLYFDKEMRVPAGRVTIYFSEEKYGVPRFYYLGSLHEIVTPSDVPAFRWCIAQVKLTGPYAGQTVKSTWENLGDAKQNTFVAQVNVGAQEAEFTYMGRTKLFLCFGFFGKVGIGSDPVKAGQSFRVYCQGSDGLTDYKCQLEVARASWPCAPDELHDLWATLYVYESWYQAQGMVIAGTKEYPRNSTKALRDYLNVMQQAADQKAAAAAKEEAEAEYQRKLGEASAALKAAEDAKAAEAIENNRKLDEADVARKAADAEIERLKAEGVKPRPDAPAAKCNWTLCLPTGTVVKIETLDYRGPLCYERRFTGSIPMNNYRPGRMCVRLTWEGKNQPDKWRVVDVHGGLAVDYNNMEVR